MIQVYYEMFIASFSSSPNWHMNCYYQRLGYYWTGFKDLLKQFLIPAPKITEKYPSNHLELFV